MALHPDGHGVYGDIGDMALRVKGSSDVCSLVPGLLLEDCGGHSFVFLDGLFCYQSLVLEEAGLPLQLTQIKETPEEELNPKSDIESEAKNLRGQKYRGILSREEAFGIEGG